jgi:hypothetical protein
MTCRFSCRILQAAQGHQYSARNDITLKITVWLPGPRVAEAHVPESQRVIGDSLPHALPSMSLNTPIEADSVGLPFFSPIAMPVLIGGKGADQHAASLFAWEV